MKNNRDGRIVNIGNEIRSEAFNLVLIIITLSVVIKTSVLNLEIQSLITELIVYFASLIYILIRNITKGSRLLDHNKKEPKKIMILVILSSIVCSLIIGSFLFINGEYNSIIELEFLKILALSFFSMIASGFIISLVIYLSDKKSIQRINKKIDE